MKRQSDTVEMSEDEAYHMHKELARIKAFDYVLKNELDVDEDKYDIVMKMMSKELRFTYERKKIR